MSSSITHAGAGADAAHRSPHRASGGTAAGAPGMTDWAWIADRIGDCDHGHRRQETAVQRREEALASAQQVMGLREHADEGNRAAVQRGH